MTRRSHSGLLARSPELGATADNPIAHLCKQWPAAAAPVQSCEAGSMLRSSRTSVRLYTLLNTLCICTSRINACSSIDPTAAIQPATARRTAISLRSDCCLSPSLLKRLAPSTLCLYQTPGSRYKPCSSFDMVCGPGRALCLFREFPLLAPDAGAFLVPECQQSCRGPGVLGLSCLGAGAQTRRMQLCAVLSVGP